MAALDYCFLWKDTDDETATVLVIVLKPHGAIGSCQVVKKGVEQFAVECVLAFLDLWGVTEVLLKSDGEAAIQALVAEVKRRRSHPTLVEVPPKYSHQSNGLVENAVRRVESLVRTYVDVVEASLKVKVGAKSLVLPWVVRHAGFVLTRYALKTDGRSSWARLRGKEYASALASIGETVDYKLVRPTQGKLEPRWCSGIFLGRRDESDEVIIGTPRGVEFARSFRKKPEEQQWSKEEYTTFLGVPWNPRGLAVSAPVAAARRKYITKAIVMEFGMTDGCNGRIGIGNTHTHDSMQSAFR